jgi:hypothetical protein
MTAKNYFFDGNLGLMVGLVIFRVRPEGPGKEKAFFCLGSEGIGDAHTARP